VIVDYVFKTLHLNLKWKITKYSKKVSMNWNSRLAQEWAKNTWRTTVKTMHKFSA
jgi:hypothetical protein